MISLAARIGAYPEAITIALISSIVNHEASAACVGTKQLPDLSCNLE